MVKFHKSKLIWYGIKKENSIVYHGAIEPQVGCYKWIRIWQIFGVVILIDVYKPNNENVTQLWNKKDG